MRGALASSTRASYASVHKRYAAWCEGNQLGTRPEAVTATRVVNWLTHEASLMRVCADTIRGYSSALASWWLEEGRLALPNPFHDPIVTRTLTGIDKLLLDRDMAARRASLVTRTLECTPELLSQLAPSIAGGSPEYEMMWAALNVASYCLLRPNEFLGSKKADKETLMPFQVRFYRFTNSDQQARVGDDFPFTPDRFELDLGRTKADQLAKNPPLPCAAAPAVMALWKWMQTRSSFGIPEDEAVFQLETGKRQLTITKLCSHLSQWVGALNGTDPPRITGKTFRRGGNAAMLLSGASLPDAMAAGRWRSAGMPAVYSGPAVNSARRVECSRSMGAHVLARAAAAHSASPASSSR